MTPRENPHAWHPVYKTMSEWLAAEAPKAPQQQPGESEAPRSRPRRARARLIIRRTPRR
jgi:hypothetical protein